MSSSSRQLYRQLIRVCSDFTNKKMAKKMKYNVREIFELHKEETSSQRISVLLEDGKKVQFSYFLEFY